jgi:MraZ protein
VHSLDHKGRVIIPAKFRKKLKGGPPILTRGFERCLFFYAPEEWENLVDKLKKIPLFKREAQRIKRTFIASAVECELDVQGRILIPPHLQKYAKIVKEVAIIGVDERIEIWEIKTWQKYLKEAEENYSLLADQLEDLNKR